MLLCKRENTCYKHSIILIMVGKHKVKSCKYIKIMLKTESYTENKPKIYQIYTECLTRIKEATASM